MPAPSRPYLIVVKTPASEYEAWQDLKKCCRAHGWSYDAIAKKILPVVTNDGCTIHRVNN
jgi:hypothetical protein